MPAIDSRRISALAGLFSDVGLDIVRGLDDIPAIECVVFLDPRAREGVAIISAATASRESSRSYQSCLTAPLRAAPVGGVRPVRFTSGGVGRAPPCAVPRRLSLGLPARRAWRVSAFGRSHGRH